MEKAFGGGGGEKWIQILGMYSGLFFDGTIFW